MSNDALRAAIVGGTTSIKELMVLFPTMDHWTIRTVRSEVMKTASIDRLPTESLKQSSPIRNFSNAGQLALRAGMFRPVSLTVPAFTPPSPIFQKAGQTYLVGSDFHAPEQDDHALDVFLQIGLALDPDGIILNGDVFNVNALARWVLSADADFRWIKEREAALAVPTKIRQTFPGKKIDFVLGNHDVRPATWIDSHAPQLAGLFTLEELLGIEDLNFDITGKGVLLAEDRLLIRHGTTVSKHSGYSIKGEIEDAWMSIIMGHTHRRGVHEVFKRVHHIRGEAPMIGVELGCMCDLNPTYLPPEKTANWQQGFAVVTVYNDNLFDVEPVRIHNGAAVFRGHRFVSSLKKEG